MRSRAAKKLDEQKRKLQKELRETENLSCLSKEVRKGSKMVAAAETFIELSKSTSYGRG